ncbi:uncharacterized protein J3D65DRAFT_605976 [Phyllosticta citribraziliensis]|uniref:F-box domain-containing protein n=1 Tax=Phyllosticta citribraziliensis TaxID=989973 RepID=A0ABR1L9S3_9PEZI
MAAPNSTPLDALPFDALLEIAGAVGALSPVCGQPGENDIVNLASTSRIMRTACQKLRFRGIIINFDDLSHVGRLDYLFSRQANHAREVMRGLPDGIRWTRSFALTVPGQPRAGNFDLNLMIQRAGTILSHVLSNAPGLRKLTVTTPTILQNLQNAAGIQGAFSLPLIEELVIDNTSRFLLDFCPNIQRLTLTGFTTSPGASFRNLSQLIARAANMPNLRALEINTARGAMVHPLPTMNQITSLTVVCQLPGNNRADLHHAVSNITQLAHALRSRMTNVQSLTLVVTGPELGSTASWRSFRRRITTSRWAELFFERAHNLQEFTIACITHGPPTFYHINPPTLLSCWRARRQPGVALYYFAAFTIEQESELELGAFSYREWRPSLEGPP